MDTHETTTASGVPVRITPGGRRPKQDYLILTADELAWLDQFRKQLMTRFPGSLADIIVYGFRARGLTDEDLAVDVLVITSDEHSADGGNIHEIRYDISLETGAYPQVMTATQSELERSFYRSKIADGISVL